MCLPRKLLFLSVSPASNPCMFHILFKLFCYFSFLVNNVPKKYEIIYYLSQLKKNVNIFYITKKCAASTTKIYSQLFLALLFYFLQLSSMNNHMKCKIPREREREREWATNIIFIIMIIFYIYIFFIDKFIYFCFLFLIRCKHFSFTFTSLLAFNINIIILFFSFLFSIIENKKQKQNKKQEKNNGLRM